MSRFNTYKAYAVGCVIAWAVLWIIVGIRSSEATQEHVLFVFLGWLLGWTSATIARAVYPPPKHRRSN
ncbi:MAG: hypothetical protein QOI03_1226 [Solirubrobacteraceae bacterium]|jgi:NhaP-type Na+/H+ or K+/H+ antiporter|nr:hypothetical protein [Solirubrobacteraceae bacterium]